MGWWEWIKILPTVSADGTRGGGAGRRVRQPDGWAPLPTMRFLRAAMPFLEAFAGPLRAIALRRFVFLTGTTRLGASGLFQQAKQPAGPIGGGGLRRASLRCGVGAARLFRGRDGAACAAGAVRSGRQCG